MIAQALRLIEGFDLGALAHNSPEHLHLVLETLKLAFADREAFYGDPVFVDVPIAELLSEPYVVGRRALVTPARAWPHLPPPGRPGGRVGWERAYLEEGERPRARETAGDTPT